MGWYAELTYYETYFQFTYEEMLAQVQYFIDVTTIEDDGDHYRGEMP